MFRNGRRTLQQRAWIVVRADKCSIWGLGWQWEQWKEDQRGKGPLVVLKRHGRFSGKQGSEVGLMTKLAKECSDRGTLIATLQLCYPSLPQSSPSDNVLNVLSDCLFCMLPYVIYSPADTLCE